MVNRLTAFLLLMLTSLVAVIAVELNSDARPSGFQGAGVQSPEINGQSLREPLRLSLPPLASLTETTARPLFVESRKPPSDAPAPVAAVPKNTEQSPNFSISAIVMTEDERAVLMNHPVSGGPVRLREGERIGGWTLDKVESDRAIFSRDGTSQSAILRTFGPPIVRQPAPRPGPGKVSEPSRSDAQGRPTRRPTRQLSPQSIRQPGQ